MQKLIKFCVICLLSFGLIACGFTGKGDLFRELLKQKGKKVASQSLENSEWYLCRGSPVGAVKDRYGVSEEKTLAYNNICKSDPVSGTSIIKSPGLIKEEVPADLVL